MKRKLLLSIPTLIFASCSNGKSMKDDTVAERYNRILKRHISLSSQPRNVITIGKYSSNQYLINKFNIYKLHE